MARREAEARVVLGHGVEGPHSGGREDAEEAVAEGVDQVGVAQPLSHLREERRGIPQELRAGPDPRKPACQPRRSGLDGGAAGNDHEPG